MPDIDSCSDEEDSDSDGYNMSSGELPMDQEEYERRVRYIGPLTEDQRL